MKGISWGIVWFIDGNREGYVDFLKSRGCVVIEIKKRGERKVFVYKMVVNKYRRNSRVRKD